MSTEQDHQGLHPVVAAVTERVVERSAATRAASGARDAARSSNRRAESASIPLRTSSRCAAMRSTAPGAVAMCSTSRAAALSR